ncbi:hypothetical protein BGX21_011278 [Mortierella sp. AD011]|nr:hypothetical protein BGX21_011278 [Mortierella sp. AD011]
MTVKLWDVETGNCTCTLQGHSNTVCSVAYSPNGDWIASGSYDQTVRLWDVETGECVRILQGHVGNVNWVAYSPNGNQIASGHDGTVRLWDVETSDVTHILQVRGGRVSYSPNGDCIASGGQDKIVRLWDVESGNCTQTLHGHDRAIYSIAYSPDGNRIASGSVDKTVRLWDVENAQCLAIISSFNGAVHSVSWNATLNGQYLVTGSGDKSVRHWEIAREQDECTVRLCWSSSHEGLTVIDASFKDIRDLSKVNQTLMGQRGALISTDKNAQNSPNLDTSADYSGRAICFSLDGGVQLDSNVGQNANVALYTSFAVFDLLSGAIHNKLGPKWTILIGCAIYYRVGAGMLWTAQGAIMMAYPCEQDNCKFIQSSGVAISWRINTIGAAYMTELIICFVLLVASLPGAHYESRIKP